jgi:hypothetical protein
LLTGGIGGAGFVGIEVLLDVLLLPGALARQARMTAAILLGEEVGPGETAFDLDVILVALGVHLTLSTIHGVVFVWLILRLNVATAEIVGLGFGLLLYLVNFYAFRPKEHRCLTTLTSHRVVPMHPELEEILREYVLGGRGRSRGTSPPRRGCRTMRRSGATRR